MIIKSSLCSIFWLWNPKLPDIAMENSLSLVKLVWFFLMFLISPRLSWNYLKSPGVTVPWRRDLPLNCSISFCLHLTTSILFAIYSIISFQTYTRTGTPEVWAAIKSLIYLPISLFWRDGPSYYPVTWLRERLFQCVKLTVFKYILVVWDSSKMKRCHKPPS